MTPPGSGERTEAVRMAVLRDRVARWSVRPEPISRTPRVGTGAGQDPETCWIDGRLMFVVGYTPGGAPYGCYADELFF